MKKVFLMLCIMAVSCLWSVDVYAYQTVSDTEAQIIQSFCQESDLYTYVHLPAAKENNALIADVIIDHTATFRQSEPITKIENTSLPVSYLFLIDNSTSMPGYRDNISKFVSDFMINAGDQASFAVATFGKQFEMQVDFTADPKKINEKLTSIEYNVKQTGLYSGIINAIDYYGKKERKEGEVYNIIVITDGIEVDKDGVTKAEVDDKLKSAPVLVHTFGLPTKSRDGDQKKASEEALKVLGSFARTSLGVHTVLGYDDKKENDLALEMIDFVNQLSLAKFRLSDFKLDGEKHSLKLRFAVTGENGSLFETQESSFEAASRKALKPIAVNPPKDSNTNTSSDQSGNSSQNSVSSLAAKADGKCRFFGLNIILFITVVVILVALLIIAVVLLVKQKRSSGKNSSSGIFMKAELLNDKCTLKNNSFYLKEELIIGRNKNCGIRLKSRDISKRNSRLYVRDNIIYIEDLNSTNGTTINNIKIYSPNKLRSGDVITIGSVKFCIKF